MQMSSFVQNGNGKRNIRNATATNLVSETQQIEEEHADNSSEQIESVNQSSLNVLEQLKRVAKLNHTQNLKLRDYQQNTQILPSSYTKPIHQNTYNIVISPDEGLSSDEGSSPEKQQSAANSDSSIERERNMLQQYKNQSKKAMERKKNEKSPTSTRYNLNHARAQTSGVGGGQFTPLNSKGARTTTNYSNMISQKTQGGGPFKQMPQQREDQARDEDFQEVYELNKNSARVKTSQQQNRTPKTGIDSGLNFNNLANAVTASQKNLSLQRNQFKQNSNKLHPSRHSHYNQSFFKSEEEILEEQERDPNSELNQKRRKLKRRMIIEKQLNPDFKPILVTQDTMTQNVLNKTEVNSPSANQKKYLNIQIRCSSALDSQSYKQLNKVLNKSLLQSQQKLFQEEMEEHFDFANRIKSNIEQNHFQKMGDKGRQAWNSSHYEINQNKSGGNGQVDIQTQIVHLEQLLSSQVMHDDAKYEQLRGWNKDISHNMKSSFFERSGAGGNFDIFNSTQSQNQQRQMLNSGGTDQARRGLGSKQGSQLDFSRGSARGQTANPQKGQRRDLKESIKNIHINIGGSDIISSFKEQRRKQLIKDMSNITPSHLKLIRDKIFSDEQKGSSPMKQNMSQSVLGGRSQDQDETSALDQNEKGVKSQKSILNSGQNQSEFEQKNWRYKHKHYANETQGLLQRNNRVVEEMTPAIEQNKELIKNLLLHSKRITKLGKLSHFSPRKTATMTGLGLTQMMSASPKERQKEAQQYKVLIDAFNDDIEILQKPKPIAEKFIDQSKEKVQKKFELQIVEAFLNINRSKGDRKAMKRISIRPERFHKNSISVELFAPQARKQVSPRKSSHLVISTKKSPRKESVGGLSEDAKRFGYIQPGEKEPVEIVSPLQPKKIGMLIRKSSNVRELQHKNSKKQDKDSFSKMLQVQKKNVPYGSSHERQRGNSQKTPNMKTVLFTKELTGSSHRNLNSQLNGQASSRFIQTYESDDMSQSKSREENLASINQQYDYWSRMLEPIFSGSCRAEVNMVDPKKLQKQTIFLSKFEQDIINEYKTCLERVQQKTIIKGVWEVKPSCGQLPDSRESVAMYTHEKEIFLYGGYEITKQQSQSWKWHLIQQAQNSTQGAQAGTKLTVSQTLQGANPGPRYASLIKKYRDKLILFGGGGPYVQSIKTRTCYNDIRYFDTVTKQWYKDFKGMKGNFVPQKRLHHGGDVIGCILAIYGGFNTEQKRVLDDLIMFDIEENAWLQSIIKYPNMDSPIGPRAEHTLTKVTCMRQNDLDQIRWSRGLWYDPSIQKEFSPKILESGQSFKPFFKYGYLMYGGYCSKAEEAVGDLWLLQPDCEYNQNLISYQKLHNDLSATYKEYRLALKAYNITKLVKGAPPLPRYGHSATTCNYGRYFVVTGGRNNQIYKKLNNIALNDICLLNTQTFEWETLAVYGQIPASRWNHGMVTVNEGQLIIFGGVNTSQYVGSQIHSFEFGEDVVDAFLTKAKENCDNLKQKARNIQIGVKSQDR